MLYYNIYCDCVVKLNYLRIYIMLKKLKTFIASIMPIVVIVFCSIAGYILVDMAIPHFVERHIYNLLCSYVDQSYENKKELFNFMTEKCNVNYAVIENIEFSEGNPTFSIVGSGDFNDYPVVGVPVSYNNSEFREFFEYKYSEYFQFGYLAVFELIFSVLVLFKKKYLFNAIISFIISIIIMYTMCYIFLSNWTIADHLLNSVPYFLTISSVLMLLVDPIKSYLEERRNKKFKL